MCRLKCKGEEDKGRHEDGSRIDLRVPILGRQWCETHHVGGPRRRGGVQPPLAGRTHRGEERDKQNNSFRVCTLFIQFILTSAVWSCRTVLTVGYVKTPVEFVPGLHKKLKNNWLSILKTHITPPIFNQFTSEIFHSVLH